MLSKCNRPHEKLVLRRKMKIAAMVQYSVLPESEFHVCEGDDKT